MSNQVLPAGSRVRVISYGPFRGLKGTIRKVDTIPGLEAGEAFCFYLVELEGTHIREPIWFECDEVELANCPSSDMEPNYVEPASPGEMRRRVVLLVGIHQNIAEVLVRALRREFPFTKLELAQTADEALRLIQTLVPDLLLIGPGLPEVNGPDLLDLLCAIEQLSTIPASHIDLDTNSRSYSYPRPHLFVLKKPIGLSKLLALIRELLSCMNRKQQATGDSAANARGELFVRWRTLGV